jgi:hypothetical protein
VDPRAERAAAQLEIPLLVAALLTIPVLLLQQGNLGEPWDTIADVADWEIWSMFALELVVMLAVGGAVRRLDCPACAARRC